MGVAVATERDEAERRLFLLAPTRRDAEACTRLLEAANISCTIGRDLPTLCELMTAGVGALIIGEEAFSDGGYAPGTQSLRNFIRLQPVWSDLPLIVLSRSGSESPTLTAALMDLGNVSVLERPVRVSTLLSMIQAALRARERQYQVRDQLIEQAQTQQLLRDREERHRQGVERLSLAMQAAGLGGWEWDPVTDAITLSNRALDIFGITDDIPPTRTAMRDLLHAEDVERARIANEKASDDHADYDVEYRARRPDGRMIWVAARGRGQYDSTGKMVRMLGVVQDITARKEVEQQRQLLLDAERTARGDAERAVRLKDEFLSVVSHELRTPLNAILGWAQILRTSPQEPDELEEGLAIIERNARAQTQIIEDLLDMSRVISGKVRLDVQRVDLTTVINSAAASMLPAADARSVRLQKVLDPHAGPISGDPNRLQQVVWNLLSNAIKFTPKGGRVVVTLQRVNSHVEISIADSGQGIKPDFLPFVFDRFRQAEGATTRRHGGLGLGLSIVKHLVELHGGTVSAKSAGEGQGATFCVALPLLPLRNQDAEHSVHPSAEPALLSDGNKTSLKDFRVLVVDDEPDSRQLIKHLLEGCDATVTMAASAAEAMQAFKQNKFDVVVSDIGMPDTDGYELARLLRTLPAETGRTPALALTAFARSEDRVRALMAGFNMHMSKPVEPAELCAAVARLAARVE